MVKHVYTKYIILISNRRRPLRDKVYILDIFKKTKVYYV